MILKPLINKTQEILALKLFAKGYRPIKGTVYPRIGQIDIAKLRSKCPITPMSLRMFAGRPQYMTHIHTVDTMLYYSLCRLSNQAFADPTNRVYTEMANQHV